MRKLLPSGGIHLSYDLDITRISLERCSTATPGEAFLWLWFAPNELLLQDPLMGEGNETSEQGLKACESVEAALPGDG